MKIWLLCSLVAVSVSVAEADEIEIQSAGAASVITVGGVYTNANYNGWDITVVAGSNFSPSLSPYGLDLSVLANCTSGNCLTNSLDVFYTAQNFTQAVPALDFQTTYSSTQTGAGTTRAITWADSTNTLFGGGIPPLGADHLGTVGSFSAPGGFGTVSGGPGEGPSAYSLTMEQIFNASSSVSSFSANGNLTALPVPVPPSLALLASGLLATLILPRRSRMRGTKE
ncbi:MAG TPA: hypothetical protein VN893_17385 [Bryobacteraceae bacterium]|nr:hypothetical protein [Bryobacteraceae bacterium]